MSTAKANHRAAVAKAQRPDVAEVIDQIAATFSRDTPNPSVCVADGYGLKVTVDGQHLVVADGIGPHRRVRKFARAIHSLARLVVIGTTGYISMEAMRWCALAGVAVVVLDPFDGAVLATSGACSIDDARIRRAQGIALGTETGLQIARYLISEKLAGQARVVAGQLGNRGASDTILALALELDRASSLEEVQQLEAAAANLAWASWGAVTINYTTKDHPKIPSNWRRFEGRRSAVNPGTARNATDPINAMASFTFRLIEVEARLAILALGLDPGLGFLHADGRGKDAFVLDVTDAARPIADEYVLRTVSDHVFRYRDFAQDGRGVVRILPPLSHTLVAAMPSFAAALAPVVERVATMLGEASPYDMSVPSALSRSKHRDAARRRSGATDVARGGRGPNPGGMPPTRKARQRPPAPGAAQLPWPVCKVCGDPVPAEPERDRPRARYCEACLAVRRVEHGVAMQSASLGEGGVAAAHAPEARDRRRAANRRQQLVRLEWETEHAGEAHDPEWYLANVLPGLAGVSLTSIAKATGMSTSAASKVRAGSRVPHPRHWGPLKVLAAG